MKLTDLAGKSFRVISCDPWEVLLEEDTGGMPGPKYLIKPVEVDRSGNLDLFGGSLEIFALKEERLKS